MKKVIVVVSILSLIISGALLYWFIFRKNIGDQIVIPYIAHQKPRIDPHVPGAVSIADKLDEVLFDGLFNVSANPSGITYDDALGKYMGIEDNVVSIRIKPNMKWHSSYAVAMEKKDITITEKQAVEFTANDIRFTMRRIQKLGSLSPDYVLIGQAIEDFSFTDPNSNGEITFKFSDGREWTENDIKEILSFKVLPATSDLNAANYFEGTGPYLYAGEYEDNIYFHKNLCGNVNIKQFILKPYIDNSTYTTELRNSNINALLSTPFGAESPILADTEKFFYKSSIATCFFAILFNTEKLDRAQRHSLRALIDNKKILERFFKIGTEQQRNIANYKGAGNNYTEYLNNSVFPTTSYYVDDEVVIPLLDKGEVDNSILPDTIRIQTCLNYGYREELAELTEIISDPTLFGGKIKVDAVQNSEIRKGNYDAVLVSVGGYRSNFMFDLYNVFLRAPDFATHKVSLQTVINNKGERVADSKSFEASSNFFRLDITNSSDELDDKQKLLDYVYGFMASSEVGDKQAYAQFIDELDQDMALGSWLFSLPSMAYFRSQFDASSIDLFGTASQLSTIEKWQEKVK